MEKLKESKKPGEVKQVTEILKYIISQNFEANFLLLNLFSSAKKILIVQHCITAKLDWEISLYIE